MQVQSLGQEDPLEEGMATHSSILAWRISWTEESGRLQYIRSQRVRHDWSDLAWHMTWDTKNFTCFPKRVLIHICFSHSLAINFLIIFYYKFMIIQPNDWSQSMNQYTYNFTSGHFYAQTIKRCSAWSSVFLQDFLLQLSFRDTSERSCSATAVDFPVVPAYNAKTRLEFSVPLSTDHREFPMRP